MLIAILDYECEEKQKLDKGIDFVASDAKSDEKILLRVITKPRSKSGVVVVEDVRNMLEVMEDKLCDKGVLISKEFSDAAKQEMEKKNIQRISEKAMLRFRPEKLYLRMRDYIDDLCKAKCGKVPEKEADCKSHSDGGITCKIRVISDNASFHFEHGWTRLLQHDFMRLIALHNSINNN